MPDSPPVIPIAVIAKDAKPLPDEARSEKSMPPTTTLQEDVVTAGQRRINLIWELTQSVVALSITGTVVYTAVKGISSEVVTNAFFLIIGFYFSRSNHTQVGGLGRKAAESQPYLGR